MNVKLPIWAWWALGAVGLIILFILITFVIMWEMRWIASAVTQTTVVEVEPGVHCAQMITADGAAIDCWRAE